MGLNSYLSGFHHSLSNIYDLAVATTSSCKAFLILSFQEGFECDNRAVINLSQENETYFGKLCAISCQGRGS